MWSDFIIRKCNDGDAAPSVSPEADHDLPEVSWFLPDCFRSPGGPDGLQLAAAGPALHTVITHTNRHRDDNPRPCLHRGETLHLRVHFL